VAPSALRYYETQGLINSVRTTGNQRRYQRSTLRRIAFVRSAQRVGLSLEEISEALGTLPGGRTPTTADWSRRPAPMQRERPWCRTGGPRIRAARRR